MLRRGPFQADADPKNQGSPDETGMKLGSNLDRSMAYQYSMMSVTNPAPTVHEAPCEVGLLPEGRRADVCHRGRTRLPGLLQVWPVPPLLHAGQSNPRITLESSSPS